MYSIILDFFEKVQNAVQLRKYVSYRKKYEIDPTFRFNGNNIILYGDGEIAIGAETYIGHYSTIQAEKNYRVCIGKRCSISHNVRIYTSSKIPDFDFSSNGDIPRKCGDVIIGNYVWIGANVFINPGVKIGDNSVIGANSVVTKDVEPFSINGGVPSRLIRKKNDA